MEEAGGIVFVGDVATNVSGAKYFVQEERSVVGEANGAGPSSILGVNKKILKNIPKERYWE